MPSCVFWEENFPTSMIEGDWAWEEKEITNSVIVMAKVMLRNGFTFIAFTDLFEKKKPRRLITGSKSLFVPSNPRKPIVSRLLGDPHPIFPVAHANAIPTYEAALLSLPKRIRSPRRFLRIISGHTDEGRGGHNPHPRQDQSPRGCLGVSTFWLPSSQRR